MVGARSALFLPYAKLGLIVVDEAHEPSFKQEEGVQYHARDVAVMRGHFEDIPVILASATPAIETRHMVEIGRYREVLLTERHAGADLPAIRAIDLTQDPPPRGRWLAPEPGRRARGQSRRRRAEPAVPQPPRLRAADPVPHLRPPLPMPQLHRLDGRAPADAPPRLPPLRPRHAAARGLCPECGDEDSLVACGPGVERIADEVAALFPDARTAIVTSDTIWSPARAAEFVRAMDAQRDRHRHRHPAGHQGLSFPQPDPGRGGRCRSRPAGRRPSRRRAQLPADPAGRRPRRPRRQAGPRAGPDPRSRRAGDRRAGRRRRPRLLRRRNRRPARGGDAAVRPPRRDRRLVARTRTRPKPSPAASAAPRPAIEDMAVFGPAPAPLAMLRGRHRQRLLVHAARKLDVQDVIRDWLGGARLGLEGPRRGRRRSVQLPLTQRPMRPPVDRARNPPAHNDARDVLSWTADDRRHPRFDAGRERRSRATDTGAHMH